MTTTALSSRRTVSRRIALHWRGCVGSILIVSLLIIGGSYFLLSKVPFAGPMLTFRTLINRLMLTGVVIWGVYLFWVLLAMVESVWIRQQARRQTPLGRGGFLGIRLPKPAATDPHGTAAARGGYGEAVQAIDPFRTLATALAAHQGDARISLELWGGSDGRVQWGLWLPAEPALVLTTQSLLTGAAPGIEIRTMDDPLQAVGL